MFGDNWYDDDPEDENHGHDVDEVGPPEIDDDQIPPDMDTVVDEYRREDPAAQATDGSLLHTGGAGHVVAAVHNTGPAEVIDADLAEQLEELRHEYAAAFAAYNAGDAPELAAAAAHIHQLSERADTLAPHLHRRDTAANQLATATEAGTAADKRLAELTEALTECPPDIQVGTVKLPARIPAELWVATEAAAAAHSKEASIRKALTEAERLLAIAADGGPIITQADVERARDAADAAAELEVTRIRARIEQLEQATEEIASDRTAEQRGDRGENAEARELAEKWRLLAESISDRLVLDPDWSELAQAIERAHTAGYHVQTEMPRLAAETPLPAHRPAQELTWRLYDDCEASMPAKGVLDDYAHAAIPTVSHTEDDLSLHREQSGRGPAR
jgi:hypothetical protein